MRWFQGVVPSNRIACLGTSTNAEEAMYRRRCDGAQVVFTRDTLARLCQSSQVVKPMAWLRSGGDLGAILLVRLLVIESHLTDDLICLPLDDI